MQTTPSTQNLPVLVIGAGPVGLAAAAHLLERGERPLVIEAGPSAGSAVRQWAHVRMFSPWRYNIDAASRRLLEQTAWREPNLQHLPTGAEIFSDYMEPLATSTPLREHIRYGERVVAVTRQDMDKVRTKDRETRPFVVRTLAPDGTVREHLAQAVLDASGTWTTPNPLGADGLPAPGEEQNADRIDYGIPDVRGARRAEFAGRTTLVVGGGHSAFNAVLELLELRDDVPDTRIVWAMRKQSLDKVFGGGAADGLPARGELGRRARAAVESGAVTLLNPFSIRRVARTEDGRLEVGGLLPDGPRAVVTDRVIVATGFRLDLAMLREVRLELDPALESARALGPLIDPNEHSCGTVRPHGARELAHPEKGFYIVGMKSYGRAPTFLLATGYEQVRSVVAELAGDHEAAARVELDLPETGVCSLPGSEAANLPDEKEGACCGGAPKTDANACCVKDEDAKAAGEPGCGCGAKSQEAASAPVPVVAAKGCCG
jgi:glycine/D-amino acid oxidase-like deaminating enzyme